LRYAAFSYEADLDEEEDPEGGILRRLIIIKP
jgi:hypothetical protein